MFNFLNKKRRETGNKSLFTRYLTKPNYYYLYSSNAGIFVLVHKISLLTDFNVFIIFLDFQKTCFPKYFFGKFIPL